MHNPTGCPSWCVVDHSTDIEHSSTLDTIAEGTLDAQGDPVAEVVAQLLQTPGKPSSLALGVCEGVECLGDVNMPLAEAERLVARLQNLIAAAGGAA